ncbi:MAG: ATP-binding protein [Candidatus Diapherotrites archaeon]|nr:ATP-binding protein [Candidatus Diapherotrites archaeon]
MKTIAVTGGKGGTGKSTVACLLALKLVKEGKKVLLYDADVECPNDHLLLGTELKEPKPTYQLFPYLDEEKCTKCGICVKACRSNAIFQAKGKFPVFLHDLCSGCTTCKLACPTGAITMKKKVSGESYFTEVRENLWLVTGKSTPGIEETGPIVSETKKRAKEIAKEKNADYLIVDTAAGLHCDVIQALLNVEQVYAVTEPTPLGMHDVSKIIELIKMLNIPVSLVINKSTIGDKKPIQELAKKQELEIYAEIPYSKELINAYMNANLYALEGLL